MTIDEAISFCDEKSKNIKLKAEPQTFVDIKEMLEELKCHRNDNDFSEYADRLYKKAYNKALEDIEKYFDNLISKGIWNTSPFIIKEYLESIKK